MRHSWPEKPRKHPWPSGVLPFARIKLGHAASQVPEAPEHRCHMGAPHDGLQVSAVGGADGMGRAIPDGGDGGRADPGMTLVTIHSAATRHTTVHTTSTTMRADGMCEFRPSDVMFVYPSTI